VDCHARILAVFIHDAVFTRQLAECTVG